MDKSEIKDIFLGKSRIWRNDQKIIYVTLSIKNKVHEQFLKKYINKTTSQYSNYLRMLIFTGKQLPPKFFKNIDDLISFVAETDGSISYIPAELVNDKVKVISEKE